MNITRSESAKTRRGPADYFTGTVWIDELTAGQGERGVGVARVTFEPGARTAWHTHPHGQLLSIISGIGRVQTEGGKVILVRPGDEVWFGPGERHWHGADPERKMEHLAVQQADAAKQTVTWLEHVSEETYSGPQ